MVPGWATAMSANFILLYNLWLCGVISSMICSVCGQWQNKTFWVNPCHMLCRIPDKATREFSSPPKRISLCRWYYLGFNAKWINGLVAMSFIWEITMSLMHWCLLTSILKVRKRMTNMLPLHIFCMDHVFLITRITVSYATNNPVPTLFQIASISSTKNFITHSELFREPGKNLRGGWWNFEVCRKWIWWYCAIEKRYSLWFLQVCFWRQWRR